MCGIVAYTNTSSLNSEIEQALKSLQYRGYDSWGVVAWNSEKFSLTKSTNRDIILSDLSAYTCGVGHTRWSTHGKPSRENAHPILVDDWFIVHNGIVPNLESLKQLVPTANFDTETDTEILLRAFLWEFNKSEVFQPISISPNDIYLFFKSIKHFLKQYKEYAECGAFIIGNVKFPNELIAYSHGSSLWISTDCRVISSQQQLISTRKGKRFESGTITHIKADKEAVYSENIYGKSTYTTSNVSAPSVNNNDNLMWKEILEIPKLVKYDYHYNFLNNHCNNVVFVGCGSSYNVGLMLATYLSGPCLLNSHAIQSGQLQYVDYHKDTQYVLLSQSGETKDTINAANKILKRRADAFCLHNQPNSTLTKLCHRSHYIAAGPEQAVASTKSTYKTAFDFLTHYIRNTENDIEQHFHNLQTIINRDYSQAVSKLIDDKPVIILGNNILYAVALEQSLKLQEVCQVFSHAFPFQELKHGPLALLDKANIIVFDSYYYDSDNNLSELKSKASNNIVLISDCKEDSDVFIPASNSDNLHVLLFLVAAQMLTYRLGVAMGKDIDKPPFLAKVVSV